MKTKQILVMVMAIIIAIGITACNKDEESSTLTNTVTGGSVEDVFDLTQSSNDGDEVTINASMIDEDSGLVTTVAGGASQSSATTVKPDIKKETTLASASITGATSNDGYKLSWNAVSGAKAYNVYRADDANSEYKFIGSTTQTTYVDKTGSSKYSYKITVAPTAASTTKVANNTSNFKGSTVQFTNENNGTTFISSNLNNAYIAFIRNEYAKKGVTCPPGRLAYVQISGQDYLYVFQFDNAKTWNGSTLEQVQIFVDKNDTSKYFSFFTKDSGSSEYMKAKETAISKWNSTQGNDGTVYDDMQALLVTLAGDPHFQTVIDASY